MQRQGLSAKDLTPMIGGLSSVVEVRNSKRPLSILMLRRLNSGLGISAEYLIREVV
jgi:HTH-type transcriptional regulator / antitoxin HigA